MEEANASALFETLYAKAVCVVKGKEERKQKLQQVNDSLENLPKAPIASRTLLNV